MPASLNIGLTAYHALGNLVFVKVPSERGRYLLTDVCVAAVACPHCVGVTGEPCRRGHWHNGVPYGTRDNRSVDCRPRAHGTGVHCARKTAAEEKYGYRYASRLIRELQLHLCAVDVAAALRPADDLEPAPPAADIDFPVTWKGQ